MDGQTVAVGLGELKLSRLPGEVLVAFGLGSCVAVCAYDPVGRIAGMLHVLLPECTDGSVSTPARYANTGVPLLLDQLGKLGAIRSRLIIKISGGASVLQITGATDTAKIGERNIKAVRTSLAAEGLCVRAADVGGTAGRTVRLEVATGKTLVRTAGQGSREL